VRISAKALYLKHYSYLLDDPDIFQIFFPGINRSTRESKHNDVIVISGKKGSGKTELAKFMAYVYHEKLPKNRVIVFSGIKDLYNDLPWAIKVDLKEVQKEERRVKTIFLEYPMLRNFEIAWRSLTIRKKCKCQDRKNVVSAGQCTRAKWKKFWDQCYMHPSSNKQRTAKHHAVTRSGYFRDFSEKL
jgi:energy-coupling factor transporter ATP-binding protein EcfA2